jgi:hypothetical protein
LIVLFDRRIIENDIEVAPVLGTGIGNLTRQVFGPTDRTAIAFELVHGFLDSSWL